MFLGVSMKQEAILIMESQPNQAGLRSSAFTSGWTRLYQAQDYYFDLSYKPDEDHGLLMGQVLRAAGGSLPSPAQAALLSSDGSPLLTEPVSDSGSFRMAVQEITGHRLEVKLDQTTFEVLLA